MAISSNRFIKCFRPNCAVEPDDVTSTPTSGVDKECEAASRGKHRGDRMTCRSLRRLAKALLFHTSFVKNTRLEKSHNNSFGFKYKKRLSKAKQAPQSANASPTNDVNTNSYHPTYSSSFNSSSRTSSTPFCSSSGSSEVSTTSLRGNEYLEYKQTKKRPWSRRMLMEKIQDLNFALCLCLVCLLILMCWGKVCAIFCTSALFVLVPRRANLAGHGRVSSPQMDLKEHKKSAIMEGLLARNRNNVYGD